MVGKNIQRNIYLLYIIKFSKWFMLFMPIVVPFYKANGLELQDLFILQAIYSISVVILEIPSGYLADVYGRKKTLLFGSILAAAGFFIYSATSGFWGFMAAEIVLGIGTSFVSGADSAMLYDTLFEMKKSKEYLKQEGRLISSGNFAEAIAGILGGFLATISIRTPYFFQTAVAFIGIPAAFFLIEPTRHMKLLSMNFHDILKIFRYAIFENKLLSRNIFFSSLIGSSTLTMAWFVQPYFELVGIPLAWYGVLWTALNLSVAIFSLIAYKIEHGLGQIKTIILITFGICFGYISLGVFKTIWAISFIFFFYLIRGIATPVLKDYINQLTTSNIRATVLSVRSFIIRLIFSIVGPFFGWISDNFTLQTALIIAGTFYFVLSSITAIMYLVAAKKPTNN